MPPSRAKRGQQKRARRHYLVKWQGLPLNEAQWRTVEDLNRGGVLDKWRDYERALLLQDPALASEEARRLHASGEMDSSDETSPQETAPTVAPPVAELDVSVPQHPVEENRVGHRRSARLRQPKREEVVAEAVAVYENENRVVNNRVRHALVLCSGTGSVEKVLQQIYPGIHIVSLDIDAKSAATHVRDLRIFVQAELFEYPPGHFDILWASPPCTEYSRAKTTQARDWPTADLLVASVLACLVHLRPSYWFIENPDGYLQHRPLMLPYAPYMQRVSYCHYGTLYRKNTCIWTNALVDKLSRCSVTTPCASRKKWGRHLCTAQAGPSNQVPGSGNGKNVYAIPAELLRRLFAGLTW